VQSRVVGTKDVTHRNLPRTVRRAQHLRRQMTDAERHLWLRLRRRQLHGIHIRKQVPIGPYVVDFACLSIGLVIEVDGGQHSWRSRDDSRRTKWLEAHGYRVLRFWNNDVLGNIDGVLQVIEGFLNPLPRDRGRVRGGG